LIGGERDGTRGRGAPRRRLGPAGAHERRGEEDGRGALVILESVEQIGKLDLSGVPPTANTSNSTNVFRPDEPDVPLQCLPRGKALSPAPEAVDGLFAVPRID
jgi:aspartyl/glutamyl-tRNA(Asn/Gln) amidotransferase C subunit